MLGLCLYLQEEKANYKDDTLTLHAASPDNTITLHGDLVDAFEENLFSIDINVGGPLLSYL